MTADLTTPCLRARVVLFDIDDTLVNNTPLPTGPREVDPFVHALHGLVQQAHQVSAAEAARRVKAHLVGNGQSLESCFKPLGIESAQFLEAIMPCLKDRVQPFDDGVEAVRTLHQRGYQLYPATTNARLICLAKLTVIGLAHGTDTRYFRDLFGGAELVPEGKTSPAFYQALLARIGADADHVVMVGDHPEFDLSLARQAGISQVVLPRRDQPEACCFEDDGGIYVRSLTWLLDALPEQPI